MVVSPLQVEGTEYNMTMTMTMTSAIRFMLGLELVLVTPPKMLVTLPTNIHPPLFFSFTEVHSLSFTNLLMILKSYQNTKFFLISDKHT